MPLTASQVTPSSAVLHADLVLFPLEPYPSLSLRVRVFIHLFRLWQTRLWPLLQWPCAFTGCCSSQNHLDNEGTRWWVGRRHSAPAESRTAFLDTEPHWTEAGRGDLPWGQSLRTWPWATVWARLALVSSPVKWAVWRRGFLPCLPALTSYDLIF